MVIARKEVKVVVVLVTCEEVVVHVVGSAAVGFVAAGSVAVVRPEDAVAVACVARDEEELGGNKAV